VSLEDNTVVVMRSLERGRELVRCLLPCLLTVVASANQPRPPSARKRIEYKMAAIPQESPALLQRWPEFESDANLQSFLRSRGLGITVWSADDIDADPDRIGLGGSPTQVHKVNMVILESTATKAVAPTATASWPWCRSWYRSTSLDSKGSRK